MSLRSRKVSKYGKMLLYGEHLTLVQHWILHIFPIILTTTEDENITGFIQHMKKQKPRGLEQVF